jgi:hypothetical protein
VLRVDGLVAKKWHDNQWQPRAQALKCGVQPAMRHKQLDGIVRQERLHARVGGPSRGGAWGVSMCKGAKAMHVPMGHAIRVATCREPTHIRHGMDPRHNQASNRPAAICIDEAGQRTCCGAQGSTSTLAGAHAPMLPGSSGWHALGRLQTKRAPVAWRIAPAIAATCSWLGGTSVPVATYTTGSPASVRVRVIERGKHAAAVQCGVGHE